MGEAVVALARKVPVRAHGRVRGGKLQKVDAHLRELDLDIRVDRAEAEAEDEQGQLLVRATLKGKPSPIAVLDLAGGPLVYYVSQVIVPPGMPKHRGIATQLLLAAHRAVPDALILHGGFDDEQGEAWARSVIERYPEWNEMGGY